jgi:hypothetical protein
MNRQPEVLIRINYPSPSEEIKGWRINALLIYHHKILISTGAKLFTKTKEG